MNHLFGVLLLLILSEFIQGKKAAEELNLNFWQNDYQLKFERVELLRYNKDDMKDAAGNDMVNVVQAYKFMSNEYRLFPLRFAANTCKGMAGNVAGTAGMVKCGNFTGCPFVKEKKYHVCNWYPDPSKLPPFIPSGQYKIEIQVEYFSREVAVMALYVTVFRPIV